MWRLPQLQGLRTPPDESTSGANDTWRDYESGVEGATGETLMNKGEVIPPEAPPEAQSRPSHNSGATGATDPPEQPSEDSPVHPGHDPSHEGHDAGAEDDLP